MMNLITMAGITRVGWTYSSSIDPPCRQKSLETGAVWVRRVPDMQPSGACRPGGARAGRGRGGGKSAARRRGPGDEDAAVRINMDTSGR